MSQSRNQISNLRIHLKFVSPARQSYYPIPRADYMISHFVLKVVVSLFEVFDFWKLIFDKNPFDPQNWRRHFAKYISRWCETRNEVELEIKIALNKTRHPHPCCMPTVISHAGLNDCLNGRTQYKKVAAFETIQKITRRHNSNRTAEDKDLAKIYAKQKAPSVDIFGEYGKTERSYHLAKISVILHDWATEQFQRHSATKAEKFCRWLVSFKSWRESFIHFTMETPFWIQLMNAP